MAEGSRTQRLIADFQSRLPQRLAAIEAAWLAVLDSDPMGPERDHLLRLVHQLAGTAGSFGFPRLSSIAAQLEGILRAGQQGTWADGLLQLREAFQDAQEQEIKGSSFPTPAFPLPRVAVFTEDEPLRAMISQQLEALSFDVRTYATASDLLGSGSVFKPNILMVDLDATFQREAAFGAIGALRRILMRKPIVTYFSVRSDVQIRKMAVDAGGQAFFVKPLNVTAMSVSLEQLFRASQLNRNRLLLLEDDPEQARFYAGLMHDAGIDADVVHRPEDFLRQVELERPDLVLLDLELPGVSGIELTALLRQHETLADVPILFLTATTDVRKHREALVAGADGVFVKGDDPAFILEVIRGRINRYRRIRHLMTRDVLTGLLNRAALMERMEHELLRAQRTGEPFCIALVDIDDFKSLNDKFGHPAGDAVIRQIASEMRSRLRAVDLLGRLGGDEFILVLPSTALEDAARVLDEIRVEVATNPVRAESWQISTSISVGLLEGTALATDHVRQLTSRLIAGADRLLYQAKRAGRNQVKGQRFIRPEL